jgi:hypothetical protein
MQVVGLGIHRHIIFSIELSVGYVASPFLGRRFGGTCNPLIENYFSGVFRFAKIAVPDSSA